MTTHLAPRPPACETESMLGCIVEKIANQLQAGEPIDVEGLLHDYPDQADELRRLLPAVEMLADLGRSACGTAVTTVAHEAETGILGDFRIIREIGRGGMGVVYEAEQISLGRRVALKLLPFAAALDPKQLQRFKNEAHAAAQLHHTNIVPVHAVGSERGVHYYAMQFIEGQTLAAMIADLQQAHTNPTRERGPSSLAPRASIVDETKIETVPAVSTAQSVRDPSFFRTVAILGIQAAEALEYAHSEGIVHRDIKPGNLLVDAKGNLWITDFGLARLGTDGGLTMTGDLLGTLRYMSPEQALAKRVIVDHRTDIYSLGVTLYELLTLEPAFGGKDRQEILRQIAFEEPKPLRRTNKAIPAELETIVLKAMEKNSESRYATAQELADDLRRWLEHKPIQAKRPNVLQQLRKWLHRYELAVVSTATAGIIGLAATAITLGFLLFFVNKRKNEVEKAYDVGLQARRDLTLNAFMLRRDLAERQSRLGTPQELSQLALAYLHSGRRDGVRVLPGRFGPYSNATFTPDSRYVVSPDDRGVALWDANSGQQVHRIPMSENVGRMAISPDGRRLAVGRPSLQLWDLPSRTLVRQLFMPHGRDDQQLPYFGVVGFGLYDIAFSPDQDRPLLATAGFDGKLKLRNATTLEEEASLDGFFALAFSPTGKEIATGVEIRKSPLQASEVVVYDVATRKKKATLQMHAGTISSIAYSPDGQDIASAGLNSVYAGDRFMPSVVRIVNANTGGNERVLKGHADAALCVVYSPDGRYLASAGLDGTVRFWDPSTGKEVAVLRGHIGPVYGVAFSPDGNRLVSIGWLANNEGEMRIWEKKWWEK